MFQEQVGAGVQDGLGVQPIVPIEVKQVAHLTETVQAQGTDPHPSNTADPRERTR